MRFELSASRFPRFNPVEGRFFPNVKIKAQSDSCTFHFPFLFQFIKRALKGKYDGIKLEVNFVDNIT
jgi:hypothetical protein